MVGACGLQVQLLELVRSARGRRKKEGKEKRGRSGEDRVPVKGEGCAHCGERGSPELLTRGGRRRCAGSSAWARYGNREQVNRGKGAQNDFDPILTG